LAAHGAHRRCRQSSFSPRSAAFAIGIIPRNRRQKLRKFTQLTGTARQTLVPGLIDKVKRSGLSHRPALEPPGATYVYVDGEPCKFFVFGHVVLGDRELENESLIEVERDAKRFLFRPQTGFGASTTPTRFIILNDDRSVATGEPTSRKRPLFPVPERSSDRIEEQAPLTALRRRLSRILAGIYPRARRIPRLAFMVRR
jgi:hypothetical protein